MSNENRDAIMSKLREVGAKSVTVEYSGSGDSGYIDDVTIDYLNVEDKLDLKVDVTVEKSTFQNGQWNKEFEVKTTELTEAIKEYCYAQLSELYSGWENNDGADGTFMFSVDDNEINLVHNDNIMTQETTESAL